MSDKIENGILYECGPFYEHDYYAPQQDTYVCSVTGKVCESVSKHFREYRAFVKRLSDANDGGIFYHDEPNLCTDPYYFGRCSVYDNFMKKVAEFAKNTGR